MHSHSYYSAIHYPSTSHVGFNFILVTYVGMGAVILTLQVELLPNLNASGALEMPS